MKRNDIQVGIPEQVYTDTQTNIEALSSPVEGMVAYATDTQAYLFYDGSTWSQVEGGVQGTYEALGTGPSSSTSGSGYAWKGTRFTLTQNIDVIGMRAYCNYVSSGSYKMGIFAMSGNTVSSILYKSANFNPAYSGNHHELLLFSDSPVTLTTGVSYLFALGRTDAGGSYVLPVPYPTSPTGTSSKYGYNSSP